MDVESLEADCPQFPSINGTLDGAGGLYWTVVIVVGVGDVFIGAKRLPTGGV